MYTRHIIMVFNPICIFKLALKRKLMLLKCFFCIFKTNIFDMI